MGGTISIQTVLTKPEMWKGLIVSAPALEKVPTPIRYLAELASKYNSKLPLPGFSLDKTGLNSNPDEIEKYLNDELIYTGTMKCGWGKSIINGITNAINSAPFWPNVPILALHGTADTITKLSDTQYFFDKLPEDIDKTFIKYPDICHELFQERNKYDIMNDILSWISNHNNQ